MLRSNRLELRQSPTCCDHLPTASGRSCDNALPDIARRADYQQSLRHINSFQQARSHSADRSNPDAHMC
jgi:hypothetical protein